MEDLLLEARLSRLRLNFLLLDILDIRLPRTLIQELHEFVERTLISLCLANDAAIVRVLHPARNAELVCFLRCGVTTVIIN